MSILCIHDQVRNGHEEITQQDFVDVLDKQLFEGMGVSLTDEEQIRTEAKVSIHCTIAGTSRVTVTLFNICAVVQLWLGICADKWMLDDEITSHAEDQLLICMWFSWCRFQWTTRGYWQCMKLGMFY